MVPRVKADAGNGSDFVFVGLNGASAGISAPITGWFKLAAQQEVLIEVDDPSKVYCVASAPGLARARFSVVDAATAEVQTSSPSAKRSPFKARAAALEEASLNLATGVVKTWSTR